jgi:hypothetical protein
MRRVGIAKERLYSEKRKTGNTKKVKGQLKSPEKQEGNIKKGTKVQTKLLSVGGGQAEAIIGISQANLVTRDWQT